MIVEGVLVGIEAVPEERQTQTLRLRIDHIFKNDGPHELADGDTIELTYFECAHSGHYDPRQQGRLMIVFIDVEPSGYTNWFCSYRPPPNESSRRAIAQVVADRAPPPPAGR